MKGLTMNTSELRFIENLNIEEYRDFCQQHKYCNILQSDPWPQVKADWTPLRLALRASQGNIIAACQVLKRALPLNLNFWYIAHGPLLDYEEEGLLEHFLKEITELAKKDSAVFIRVHPPLVINSGSIESFREGNPENHYSQELLNQRFKEVGFQLQERGLAMADTIQPRFQAVIYKEKWDEEANAKLRYNLKQCERYHLSPELGGKELLDDFVRLIELTEEEKEIKLRDRSYFERILAAFGDDAQILMANFDYNGAITEAKELKANLEKELSELGEKAPKKSHQIKEQITSMEKDLAFYKEIEDELKRSGQLPGDDFTGQTLRDTSIYTHPHRPSAVMVIRYGRWAEMPYAGSDKLYKRIPAVFQLYVRGIRDAFDQGCERYNLGGVEGTLDDGLTTFKSHFDPVLEETAGEYDLALKPILYAGFKTALKMRKQRSK